MITDAELQGIAAQALNLAKRDIERDRLNFLLATYHEGEGLYRMEQVEAQVCKMLGMDWLNSGARKDRGFAVIRKTVDLLPPDAVVFAARINKFESTAKLLALPQTEALRMATGGADQYHRLAKQGYFRIVDAVMCCAQTPERVCMYVQERHSPGRLPSGAPQTEFFDQSKFRGRMKMFGNLREENLG
jgi:hypothetical protein